MLLVLSDRTVDLDARRVIHDEGIERLTPREAALLRCLLERAGQTVTRDTLLAEVWDIHRAVVTRCVDTTVHRVRLKIEVDPSTPRHLHSAPGEGYRLELHREVGASDDGRGAERARLLAAWQSHARVFVVGPPGCGAEDMVRAAIAERGWRLGVDVRIVGPEAPGIPGLREAVIGAAPPGAPMVILGPLAPSNARERLLRACRRLGVLGEPDLESVLAACDAQPEVLDRIAALLQGWSAEALLPRLADPLRCFPDLAAMLEPRWATLGPSARRALAALAAIEGPLDLGASSAVLGVPSTGFDPLLRGGWVHERAGRVDPGRLVRAFVRARAPDPDTRRRWALSLPGDWLAQIRGARAAGVPLPRVSPEALSASLEVCLADAPDQAAVLCRALDATVIDEGHQAEVIRFFDRVLQAEVAPADRALVLRMRGTAHRRDGNLGRALRDLDAAVTLATDPTERGLALGWRATLHQVALDLDAAVRDLTQAIDAIVDPRQRIACGTALALVLALQGHPAVAIARARGELQAARELDHQRLLLLAERCLGSVLVEVGEGFEGRPRVERAEAMAGELGAARQRVLCQIDLGRAALEAGDADRAAAWFDEARQRADGRGFAWIDGWLAELQAFAAWGQGDLEAATGWFEAAVVRRRDEDPATAGVALGSLALLHRRRGTSAAAASLGSAALLARWPGDARARLRDAIRARLSGQTDEPPACPLCWEHRVLRALGAL